MRSRRSRKISDLIMGTAASETCQTEDVPGRVLIDLLRSDSVRALADSHKTIKAVGLARVIEKGLLGDTDIERLVAAGLLEQTADVPVLTPTGRTVIYALSAWFRQRERSFDFIRDNLPCLKGRRLLDLGCGEGYLVAHALEQGAALAAGIDLLPVMVRFAQAVLASELVGERGADLVLRAAAEQLPFDRASFEVITSRLAFGFFDLSRAVPEIARVLAPGGYVYITVNDPWYYASRLLRTFPPRGMGESVVALLNAVPAFFGLPAWRFEMLGRTSRSAALTPTTVRRWFGRHGIRAVSGVDGVRLDHGPRHQREAEPGTFHIVLRRPGVRHVCV